MKWQDAVQQSPVERAVRVTDEGLLEERHGPNGYTLHQYCGDTLVKPGEDEATDWVSVGVLPTVTGIVPAVMDGRFATEMVTSIQQKIDHPEHYRAFLETWVAMAVVYFKNLGNETVDEPTRARLAAAYAQQFLKEFAAQL